MSVMLKCTDGATVPVIHRPHLVLTFRIFGNAQVRVNGSMLPTVLNDLPVIKVCFVYRVCSLFTVYVKGVKAD